MEVSRERLSDHQTAFRIFRFLKTIYTVSVFSLDLVLKVMVATDFLYSGKGGIPDKRYQIPIESNILQISSTYL